jgi:hypothetical protein
MRPRRPVGCACRSPLQVAALLQLALLLGALLGRFIPALPFRIAYYYVTVTASIAVGLWDRIRAGSVPVGWEKVEGTR